MPTNKRVTDADTLRNFEQYQKDQAFVRRYQKAIVRLVEDRAGDRDTLWRFRDAIRPGSEIDPARIPVNAQRYGARAWEPTHEAGLYTLLSRTVVAWWLYHEHRLPRTRRRYRALAQASLNRLWKIIKNGATVYGNLKTGYTLRPLPDRGDETNS